MKQSLIVQFVMTDMQNHKNGGTLNLRLQQQRMSFKILLIIINLHARDADLIVTHVLQDYLMIKLHLKSSPAHYVSQADLTMMETAISIKFLVAKHNQPINVMNATLDLN